MDDVLILDHQNDTLLYAEKIVASINKLNTKEKILSINRLNLINPTIKFKSDSLNNLNLTVFLNDLIKKDSLEIKDSSQTPFDFSIFGIEIKNGNFVFAQFNPEPVEHLNVSDINLSKLDIKLSDFKLPGDTIQFVLEKLNAQDKSGFTLNRFEAFVSIHESGIKLKKLYINTPLTTLNFDYLEFRHQNFDSYSDFLNQVYLKAKIRKSLLSSKTLAYFIPSLNAVPASVYLQGDVSGSISNLRIRNFSLNYSENTILQTSLSINGLPDVNNTFILCDISQLSTNYSDISNLLNSIENSAKTELPDLVQKFETVFFKGNITGLINDIVLYGDLKTKLGDVNADISLKNLKNNHLKYKGNVKTFDFNLGNLLDNQELFGKLSLSTLIDGELLPDKKAKAFTDAKIHSFEFNNYNYHDLSITGNLANNKYDGAIKSGDPNFNLNFLGNIDFSQEIPAVNFSAYVPKANLSKLNIDKGDTTSTLSFLLTANFTGKNFDNLNGQLKIVNSVLRRKGQALRLKKFYMYTDNSEEKKIIRLNSDYLDAELASKFDQATAINSLQNMFFDFFPILNNNKDPFVLNIPADNQNTELEDVSFYLVMKNTDKIFDMFLPGIKIANNTKIKFGYSIHNNKFSFNTNSQLIEINNNKINNLHINGTTKDSALFVSGNTNIKVSESLALNQLKFDLKSVKNDLGLNLHWENDTLEDIGPGDLNLYTKLKRGEKNLFLKSNILPSSIFLAGKSWKIDSTSLTIDSSSIDIGRLLLNNYGNLLSVSGKISEDEKDTMHVALKEIDLSIINWFTEKINYKFKGSLSGKANITGIYDKPIINSDLSISNLFINDSLIGDGLILNNWNNEKKAISTYFSLRNSYRDLLKIEGDFYALKDSIDFSVALRDFDLYHIQPFTKSFSRNASGKLFADLNLTGNTSMPLINGDLYINEGSLIVDYTNVKYKLESHVKLVNNTIQLSKLELNDQYGNFANVYGNVNNTNFKDISLDLFINYNDFHVLNTGIQDNETFYGNVFLSGEVVIKGPPNKLALNIKTKTEENTRIFVPLSSSGKISQTDFLTFKSANQNKSSIQTIGVKSTNEEKEEASSDISLNIDLNITPEAIAQIIIDSKVGDIIKAQGRGDLNIKIEKGEFSIFGDYEIEKGDYLFTLQNIINKKFRIENGGTIKFNKDPLNAEVNMVAYYSTKAPLNQLIPDNTGKYDKKTPVDCQIFMNGYLTSPEIRFGINLPTADSETKSIVNSLINTEEEMSKQFLSLLVINSFIPDPNLSVSTGETDPGSLGAAGAFSTASELLSNQLSHWLSQISNDFEFGINYRPGAGQIAEDEIELALSTQLLNDRITINTNVDVGVSNNNENSNNFAGDFTVEVKVNETGTIRLKGFNRSNDELLHKTNDYTQGIGIFYRVDFDNLKELFNKLKFWKKKTKKNKQTKNDSSSA